MIPRPPKEQKAYQEGFQRCVDLIAKGSKQLKWEKEFEDEINLGESTEGAVYPYLIHRFLGFEDIFEKYLEVICNGSPMKVKIKCKNGCIQIERIK